MKRYILAVCLTVISGRVQGWVAPKHPGISPRISSIRSGIGNEKVIIPKTTTKRFSTTNDATTSKQRQLTENQLRFCLGYLNKHHKTMLRDFVRTFSPLALIAKKKNLFSGGSYKIEAADILDIDMTAKTIHLNATVMIRGEKGPSFEDVFISLEDAVPVFIQGGSARRAGGDSAPSPPVKILSISKDDITPLNEFVRRMNRLCHMSGYHAVTGFMIQLGVQLREKEEGDQQQQGVGELKENMYLNQVPFNRYLRQYFYEMASKATFDAVVLCSQGKISNRMQLTLLFPELNPSMDTYRIGTLLELTRKIAIRLAEDNLRVRICVQRPMGEGIFVGLPKMLGGVSVLLNRMDWQSGEGEENEGMVGNYVNFGGIGKEDVVNAHVDKDGNEVPQDDVFLLICPQSMVGVDSSISGVLQEMADAVGDRPIILINPDLVDRPSSGGQQSVRGRQQRIDFANSFKPVFHFENIYTPGTSYFPILGSITKLHPTEPWVGHQRKDRVDNGGEVYVPAVSTEEKPESSMIAKTFRL